MQEASEAARIQTLTRAIERSLDGIVIANPDDTIALANSAWLSMHGFAPDDAVTGRPLRIFHTDAQMKRDVQPFLHELALRGVYQGRVAHVRRDGTTFETWTAAALLPTTEHQPGGYVAVAHRQRNEDPATHGEVRRATAFLDSIVENIPHMIFVKDADLRFVLFNRAGEELLGRVREEMIGKNDYDFFPRGQADFFTGKDREVLGGTETVEIFEEPIQTGTKGLRWLHTKKIPIQDDHGTRYMLGIAEDITERKNIEEALRANDERFRLLIGGISDHAIFLLDAQGRVQTWNAGAERIFGHDEGSILGHPLDVFTRTGNGQLLSELLTQAALEGRVEFEGPCFRRDGSSFWGNVGITALGKDGAQFAMVTTDRTEERHAGEHQRVLALASQAMSTSLDFQTTLLEAARAAVPALADACVVCLTDPETSHSIVASTHASVLRRRLLARIGRTFCADEQSAERRDLLSTKHPLLFAKVTNELLENLAATPKELRLLKAAGARSAMLVPLFARGRRLGLLVLWYDVSDRCYDVSDLNFAEKLAKRAAYDIDNARLHTDLERAERGHRLLSEASKLWVESTDPLKMLPDLAKLVVSHVADGCFVDMVDEDGGVVRVAMAFASPDIEAKVRASSGKPPLGEMLAPTARALREKDIQLVTGARADRPYSAVLAAPLIARGRTLGALTLVSATNDGFHAADVAVVTTLAARVALAADNARLLLRAEEALQARDEFLSVASHELRTPLTALQLQLQSLQRIVARENVDPRVADKLGPAARQVVKLGRLVDGVLDVSRIVGGRLQLELAPTDLADTIIDVVARFAEEANSHGCELRTHIEAHPIGQWDQLRLEQIATNLIANAIKYAPDHPVDITVRGDADSAVLSVRDYGIGVPPSSVERIFGRFERAVSTRSYGGMGLGLYITRQIVEAHGGAIRVKSEPGAGAEFVVQLPLTPPKSPNTPESAGTQ